MSLVEIDGAGKVKIEELPFTPRRGVRILRGKHAELLLATHSNDFVKVVLTDEAMIVDGMKRLRVAFPNACELIYERDERARVLKPLEARIIKSSDPLETIGDFLALVRNERMTDTEAPLVKSALDNIQRGEDAA
jgi:exonuclease SbcD